MPRFLSALVVAAFGCAVALFAGVVAGCGRSIPDELAARIVPGLTKADVVEIIGEPLEVEQYKSPDVNPELPRAEFEREWSLLIVEGHVYPPKRSSQSALIVFFNPDGRVVRTEQR